VVVIVGDVAVVAIADLSRRVGERVPDGGATAILADGAFDLVGAVAVPHRNFGGKAREASRPGPAPQRGRASDGAAIADTPSTDAPTIESWRRVNRVGMAVAEAC
jgi:hypothetical protein